MNDVILKKNIKIENLIYEIRGKQVMLDSDLARLYECVNGTKTINQAVKRNIERFPKDFYFQLTENEFLNLKSQIGTSSLNNYGGVRKCPYVFTEQGVAMLATVLRTSVASQMSVAIMRAFVIMRKYVSIVKRLNIKVVIVTKANNLLTEQDIIKYNKQYNNLTVKYDNTFHDRYFILDNKFVYHCGASVNRIGYKTFSITLIGDNEVCKLLLDKLGIVFK